MKFSIIAIIAALASTPSFASDMLGDSILFERLYPNASTPAEPAVTRLVAAGDSDIATWGGAFPYGFMNPEATTISYSTLSSTSFIGSAVILDGFRFSGFTHDIISAQITVNTTGLSLELGNDLRTVLLNVSGPQNSNQGFTIDFVFAPVPEPSATALMALGLLFGCASLRQRL